MSPITHNATRSTLSTATNNAHSNPIEVTPPATLDNCKQCLDTHLQANACRVPRHQDACMNTKLHLSRQSARKQWLQICDERVHTRSTLSTATNNAHSNPIKVTPPATLDNCKQCLDTHLQANACRVPLHQDAWMNTKLHLSRQSARKQWLQICDERVHTRSTLSTATNNAHSNPIKVTPPATLDNCKQCLDTHLQANACRVPRHQDACMNTKLHLSRQSARKQWLQICDERVHTRSTLSTATNNAHSNPIKVTPPATLDNCKQCLDTHLQANACRVPLHQDAWMNTKLHLSRQSARKQWLQICDERVHTRSTLSTATNNAHSNPIKVTPCHPGQLQAVS